MCVSKLRTRKALSPRSVSIKYAWRLSLLFVVSGYASRALLRRAGGVGGFMRNRSFRLLVPLAFGLLLVAQTFLLPVAQPSMNWLGAGFLLEGRPVVLSAPVHVRAPAAPTRTASGSVAVAGARARVARASRIFVEGKHDDWLKAPRTCLAYVVIVDQLSRNMFRGQRDAFAFDGLAQSATLAGMHEGFGSAVPLPGAAERGRRRAQANGGGHRACPSPCSVTVWLMALAVAVLAIVASYAV